MILGGLACSSADHQVQTREPALNHLNANDDAGAPSWPESVAENLNQSVSPCDNFYEFACGGWLARNEIPEADPMIGRTFGVLHEKIAHELAVLLADTRSGPATPEQIFFSQCLDEAQREKRGISPILPVLREIDGIADHEALLSWVGKNHGIFSRDLLYRLRIDPATDDPSTFVVNIGPPTLGLPDRMYYLDPRGAELRSAYEGWVSEVLIMLGESTERAKEQARQILAFEEKVASFAPEASLLRNPEASNHLFPIDAAFPWLETPLPSLWRDLSVPPTRVNVSNPHFITEMNHLLIATNLELLRSYAKVISAKSALPVLHAKARDLDFRLRHLIQGSKAPPPRWRECVNLTTAAFRDEVGLRYVRAHFSPQLRDVATLMLDDIEWAFRQRVAQLSWMDTNTQHAALQKVDKITRQIGYPDRYTKIQGGGDQVAQTYFNRLSARWRSEQDHLLARVDHANWIHSASTMNAYYDAAGNRMLFPAGILQAPFFSAEMPMAMNYGAIGMVMGHELIHGFDDAGRRFDGEGRLRPWWTPASSRAFESRAQCFVETYSNFEAAPDVFLDGQLELGENLADHGGIRLAWAAYKRARARDGKTQIGERSPTSSSLHDDQLFFLSYAQSWCTNAKPEFEQFMARTDEHASPKARVNVTLGHFDPFHETFKCRAEAPMRPKRKCEVW
jgi:endothelin-converting enzyme/putative endopeptidase